MHDLCLNIAWGMSIKIAFTKSMHIDVPFVAFMKGLA
jgi:hypothetical protein